MNKQLLIIRHASASWPEDIKSDFERPLKKKGRTEAEDLALYLKDKAILPDYVICSPSKRTSQTFQIINHQLKLKESSIYYNANIYETSYKNLFKIITSLDDKYHLVSIIGHNNGLSDLVNYLLDKTHINLPPAGMVLLEFPFDEWKMISKGLAEVKLLHYPED